MENRDLSFVNKMINDNSLITLSWGISDLVVSQEELSFFVCGFKFVGKITIKMEHNGLLEVNFENEETCYTLLSSINDIISQLDRYIEYGDNYSKTVLNM